MPKNTEFFIPGKLPGFNEIITSAKDKKGRGNRYERQKREITFSLCRIIKAEKVSKSLASIIKTFVLNLLEGGSPG